MGTITKDFSYAEFEKSETADARGICNVIRTSDVRDAVKELTEELLQPLRDAWGSGINISSGYRCRELNEAVGGAKTSAHLTGYAADLVPANHDLDGFCAFAEAWLRKNGKAFDQCARERNPRTRARWLHLGLKGPKGRQSRAFYDWVKK